MGGCYDRSLCYSKELINESRNRGTICRESRSRDYSMEKVRSQLKQFFATKDIENLISAYRTYENTGKESGFFKVLMDYKKISEAPKEVSDYEIESKLEILLITDGRKKVEPKTTDILNALEFPATKSSRYIKDAINSESKGENSFFGTDGGDERFVIIQKGGNWYLKEKGAVEPYNYGIPGEQIVLRRSETRVETNPLQVAQTLMQKYGGTQTKYQGVIEKVKSDAYLLNTLTGRMYGVTVSDAKTDNRRQMQLEIEYAGYIPGFTIDLNNERSIVEDIVNMNKQVLLLYNNIKVNEGYRVRFAPTTERKYDFVTGKKQLEEPKEKIALAGVSTPEFAVNKRK